MKLFAVVLLAVMAASGGAAGQQHKEHRSAEFRFRYPAHWEKSYPLEDVLAITDSRDGGFLFRVWDAPDTDCLRANGHAGRVAQLRSSDKHWNGARVSQSPNASRYEDNAGGWEDRISNKEVIRPGGPTAVTQLAARPGFVPAVWEFVSFCSAGRFVLIELRLRNPNSAARELVLNSFSISDPEIVGTWQREGDECDFFRDGRYQCTATIFGSATRGRYAIDGSTIRMLPLAGAEKKCGLLLDHNVLELRCVQGVDRFRRK